MLSRSLKSAYTGVSVLEEAVSTLCLLSHETRTMHAFSRYQQMISRFLRVTAHRRFFVTRDGDMGLEPPCMKQDDTVVVLCGGRVPFILRQVDGDGGGTGKWTLVGECYVEGLMQGEVVARMQRGNEGVSEERVIGLERFTLY